MNVLCSILYGTYKNILSSQSRDACSLEGDYYNGNTQRNKVIYTPDKLFSSFRALPSENPVPS